MDHIEQLRQAAQDIESAAFWRFAEWFQVLEADAAEQRAAGNLLKGNGAGDGGFLTDTQCNVAQVEALLRQIMAGIGGVHGAECKMVQASAVKLVLDTRAVRN